MDVDDQAPEQEEVYAVDDANDVDSGLYCESNLSLEEGEIVEGEQDNTIDAENDDFGDDHEFEIIDQVESEEEAEGDGDAASSKGKQLLSNEGSPADQKGDGKDEDFSDSSSDDNLDDTELHAMLEKGIDCQSIKKKEEPTEGKPIIKHKTVLKEFESDPFDILPEGWISVTHNCGMLVYLHKESRVCTMARPYSLGTASARTHSIPISAIPCFLYRRQLDKFSQQGNGNAGETTQSSNTFKESTVDNCQPSVASMASSACQESGSIPTLVTEETTNPGVLSTTQLIHTGRDNASHISQRNSVNIRIVEDGNISLSPGEVCPMGSSGTGKDLNVAVRSIECVGSKFDHAQLNTQSTDNLSTLPGLMNSVKTDAEQTDNIAIKTSAMNACQESSSFNGSCPMGNPFPSPRCIGSSGDGLDSSENNVAVSVMTTSEDTVQGNRVGQEQFARVKHVETKSRSSQNLELVQNDSTDQSALNTNLPREHNDSSCTSGNKDEDPSMCTSQVVREEEGIGNQESTEIVPSGTNNSLATIKRKIESLRNKRGGKSRKLENGSSSCAGWQTDKANVPVTTIPFGDLNSCNTNAGTNETIKASAAAVKIKSAEERAKESLLDSKTVQGYCSRLFHFKVIEVKKYSSWRERRKHMESRKKNNRPELPSSTKLITCPIPGNKQEAGGDPKRKEFVLNPTGKSYLCILHEYMQRTLKIQPHYEFKELENSKTPYGATVTINNIEYGTGYASSKKVAKQEAAKETLKILIPDLFNKMSDEEIKASISDLSFFDNVKVNDPRVNELGNKVGLASPFQLLQECLRRNFGMGDTQCEVSTQPLKNQKCEFSIKAGKHSAKVVAKNKRDGKQLAAQAILAKLHPHVPSWGSLLRLYGTNVDKPMQKPEEINREKTRAPNLSVLASLREEMMKLHKQKEAIQVKGKIIISSKDLPNKTVAVDL